MGPLHEGGAMRMDPAPHSYCCYQASLLFRVRSPVGGGWGGLLALCSEENRTKTFFQIKNGELFPGGRSCLLW